MKLIIIQIDWTTVISTITFIITVIGGAYKLYIHLKNRLQDMNNEIVKVNTKLQDIIENNIHNNLDEVMHTHMRITGDFPIATVFLRYISEYIHELALTYSHVKSRNNGNEAKKILRRKEVLGKPPSFLQESFSFLYYNGSEYKDISYSNKMIDDIKLYDKLFKEALLAHIEVNLDSFSIRSFKSAIIEHFRVFLIRIQDAYYEELNTLLQFYKHTESLKELLMKDKIENVIERMKLLDLDRESEDCLIVASQQYYNALENKDTLTNEEYNIKIAKVIRTLNTILNENR